MISAFSKTKKILGIAEKAKTNKKKAFIEIRFEF
jgi:hypothetical protein